MINTEAKWKYQKKSERKTVLALKKAPRNLQGRKKLIVKL